MSIQVSVLIDTYNHEKYIEAAINSVLAQALGNAPVDIVVIDDGSTDGTKDIVGSFGNAVRYYYKPNGGQASAFNMGIPLCKGHIICFLDGDDWWHPDKLSTVLSAFVESPEICAVGHSFWEIDEVSGQSYRNGPYDRVLINYSTPKSIALFQHFSCCLGTSRLAIRRSIAMALLDVPEPLIFEADEYLFTLLPTLGRVILLPEVLTYYRIHGANLFQNSRFERLRFSTDSRLIKRASIYGCLSRILPIELSKRGCSPSTIDNLLRPIDVQASRLKLITRGGTPFENFRSEWRAAKQFERNTAARKAMLCISLTLALVCPPKWYFGMRQTYSNMVRRFRQPRSE